MGLRRRLLPGLLTLPAVLSLSCRTQTTNLPPDTPELASSEPIVVKGGAVSFSATATDPDGGAVSFRFSWGDGDTSDWSLWVASGDTATMTHAWADTGTFVTTAQARDEDDARSGWSSACSVSVALTVPGRLRWRYDLYGGAPRGAPSVGPDGTVYVLERYGSLVALSESGSFLWEGAGFSGATGTPVIGPDSVLYLGNGFAAGHSGRLLWRVESIPDLDRTPALGADGTIHYGRAALNPDGTVKWEFAEPSRFTGLAIGRDGTIYFGAWADDTTALYALNPDGTVRWRYKLGCYDWFGPPAIGPDGSVYIAANDDTLLAIDADGGLKWNVALDFSHECPVIVGGDGTVFCFSADRDLLYSLTPAGELKWRFGAENGMAVAPAVAADGTVYVADLGGAIHALDGSGTRLWVCETGSYPVTQLTLGPDGTVYFANWDGYVVAVGGSCPPPEGGWPMLGHDPQHTGRAPGP